MRRKGFDYKIKDVGGGRKEPGGDPELYGITDAAAAQSSGYRGFRSGSGPKPLGTDTGPMRKIDQENRMPPAYLMALRGFVKPSPDGRATPTGCVGEATAMFALSKPALAQQGLLDQIVLEARRRTDGDSRVVKVRTAWSDCMKGHGFSYRSPDEPPKKPWPARVGRQEIGTAVADVRCKEKTNLPGVMLLVYAEHQRRLIEPKASALEEIRTDTRAKVKKAQEILAKG